MAGAIRNSCVARGTIAANTSPSVYTVPANNAFIAKSVLVSTDNVTSSSWGLLFNAVGGTSYVYLVNSKAFTTFTDQWQSWAVLNAGDQILMSAGGQTVHYWISGAVLPFNPTL